MAMSALGSLAGGGGGIGGLMGGSGGDTSGPITTGDTSNRSINIVGASGGSTRDLAQILALSNAPSENGGYFASLLGEGSYNSLTRSSGIPWTPIILIGGILGAILLFKKL
jgi:hypothetical protein